MKSFRKFSQRKENRDYMNQEESVYELNRIQRYIMQMRPLLKKNALFSDGTADYRQPVEPDAGDEVTVRFRTARDNVDIVWLCTGDKKYKMKKTETGGAFDYYEVKFTLGEEPFYYYFKVASGLLNVYYDRYGVSKEKRDEYRFCIIPGFSTPEWSKGAVMYQILVDRFYNGDTSNDVLTDEYYYIRSTSRKMDSWDQCPSDFSVAEFYGGDLEGVRQKLDYLQNLGINGLYLTPINEAPSNHKYDTTDYTKIDPRFGDEETFKHLVKEAHKRGIRVMLDGVFNHSGYYFAPWQDVLAKGPESEYYDWFMINEWPFDKNGQAAKKKQYYTFAFFDSMPKINTNNPKVRKYFVDICANWVENYGIDGIRLDVANEVSHRFCKELHARVKEINPDIYILGEIWHNALPWLRGDEFDAVMNYPLGQSIKDFWIDKSLTNEDFEYTINRCYTSYMQQTNDVLFNLLDSHDTKRLRSDVKNLDEYFAQIAVLFAMPGSPCIYYGTEIAMEGSYDPDCRRCMPWSDIEAGKYAERSRIISTLIHLRRQEPLLKSRNFHFPNDYAAYRRVIQFQKVDFPDCYVEVLINCCEEDVEVVPQGEILLERHYIDSTLLSNGILIRRIRK